MKRFVLFLGAAVLALGCSTTPTAENAAIDHSGHSVNAAGSPDHSKMDHGTMDHSKMESSPGAASAPYDLQFIDTMILHHQGAVDMSRDVKERGEDKGLIALAAVIIAEQEREIAEMRKWRSEWFNGKPEAVNMDLAGMREGMEGMDTAKLSTLSRRAFDLEFVRQMIPHHKGAVEMAREAERRAERPEIKKLAAAVIKAQEAEIAKMEEWEKNWSK